MGSLPLAVRGVAQMRPHYEQGEFRDAEKITGGFFMETDYRERQRRNRLLWVLCGATFLIFFQAFMVAPLLPRLAQVFGVPIQTIGLIIPAYLIPYGVATLVY